MRKNNKLSIESLERREVFSGMPGFEGFDIYDAPLQVTDEEIIEALNNGTQFTSSTHTVTSPRDAASGLPTGKRSEMIATRPADKSTPITGATVDQVFAEPSDAFHSLYPTGAGNNWQLEIEGVTQGA